MADADRTSTGERAVLVKQAYKLAYVERLQELRGQYQARFDKRGLHPYSVIWGQIMVLTTPENDDGMSPLRMRKIAHAEADLDHFDRQRDVLTREDYESALAEAKGESDDGVE